MGVTAPRVRIPFQPPHGRVTERLKELVSKTRVRHSTRGSNPLSSLFKKGCAVYYLLMYEEQYEYESSYTEILGLYDSYERVDAAAALYLSTQLAEILNDFKSTPYEQWDIDRCVKTARSLNNSVIIIPLELNPEQ